MDGQEGWASGVKSGGPRKANRAGSGRSSPQSAFFFVLLRV